MEPSVDPIVQAKDRLREDNDRRVREAQEEFSAIQNKHRVLFVPTFVIEVEGSEQKIRSGIRIVLMD